jgi:hypothetical protein
MPDWIQECLRMDRSGKLKENENDEKVGDSSVFQLNNA